MGLNPKILYTDLNTYTFSAPSGTTAAYPLTNLNNYFGDIYWQGVTGSTPQYLDIDMGSTSATVRNCAIIQGHNLYGLTNGNIGIYAAANPSFTGSTQLTALSSSVFASDPIFLDFGTTAAQRYYRIGISGTPTAAPYMSNVFIDKYIEFTSHPEYPYKKGDIMYNTSVKSMIDGSVRNGQEFGGRLVNEFNFTLQNDQFARLFQTFVKAVRGKMLPWYLIDADNINVWYGNLDLDYLPIVTQKANWNDIMSLRQKTQLVKNTWSTSAHV